MRAQQEGIRFNQSQGRLIRVIAGYLILAAQRLQDNDTLQRWINGLCGEDGITASQTLLDQKKKEIGEIKLKMGINSTMSPLELRNGLVSEMKAFLEMTPWGQDVYRNDTQTIKDRYFRT